MNAEIGGNAMRTGAVIVAAGLSSRMKEFKPMLCLGEKTVIEHTIGALREAGVAPITVVVGYKGDVLRRHLSGSGVRFAENPRYAQTKMFDSILIGLSDTRGRCDRVFLMPADVPLVRTETLLALLGTEGPLVRPVYGGKGGHPLLADTALFPALKQHNGEGGLRGAIEAMHIPMVNVPVDDEGILLDADTPADYKKLIHLENLRRGQNTLRMELQLQLAVEEVFLTPETAQLLEMVENTGSIQTACACMHMSYSKGWKAINFMEKQLGFPVLLRSAGGAEGGGSALTERGKRLLLAYQRLQNETREAAQRLFAECFAEELSAGGQKTGDNAPRYVEKNRSKG